MEFAAGCRSASAWCGDTPTGVGRVRRGRLRKACAATLVGLVRVHSSCVMVVKLHFERCFANKFKKSNIYPSL